MSLIRLSPPIGERVVLATENDHDMTNIREWNLIGAQSFTHPIPDTAARRMHVQQERDMENLKHDG